MPVHGLCTLFDLQSGDEGLAVIHQCSAHKAILRHFVAERISTRHLILQYRPFLVDVCMYVCVTLWNAIIAYICACAYLFYSSGWYSSFGPTSTVVKVLYLVHAMIFLLFSVWIKGPRSVLCLYSCYVCELGTLRFDVYNGSLGWSSSPVSGSGISLVSLTEEALWVYAVGAKPSLWCAWCSSVIVWYGQPGTYSATGVSYTLLMWCQLMCAFVELPLFISAYCRLIFWCVCTLCYLEFCVCHPKRAVQWILNLHYWLTYFTHSMWQAFMIESLELKECLD